MIVWNTGMVHQTLKIYIWTSRQTLRSEARVYYNYDTRADRFFFFSIILHLYFVIFVIIIGIVLRIQYMTTELTKVLKDYRELWENRKMFQKSGEISVGIQRKIACVI